VYGTTRQNFSFCSYDVVLTAGKAEILEKFNKFNARVVFSAEGFCWPDPSLAVRTLYEMKIMSCLIACDCKDRLRKC
jgi:hypothetical protein